ncbi:MAG: succinylglutamate desuccinylase/aspartoacylase family protein [Cyanobacteria bacterium]|nr:succinylglutamate desuccinylase/aspartoacylase family protein [Cyanobacteriota bacterium]MDA1020326.1 succinylglutamate desuccinylase/aspartoacylase family protein [Cyanobacteriota bacterium]
MHGDEINGVEICRRLLQHKILKKIKGTIIVVPIINVFGLITSHAIFLMDVILIEVFLAQPLGLSQRD